MRRFSTLFLISAVCLVALHAGTAHAAATDIFSGPDGANDIALGWIEALFPTDGQKTALVVSLEAFANALMVIATLTLAWHTLSGIVSTAHEGRFLGNKWHQIWAPIRVVVGVALITPAFGGLTLGHQLIRVTAETSSHMATYVWVTFGHELLKNGIANVDVGGSTEVYSSVAQRDASLGTTTAGAKLGAALGLAVTCRQAELLMMDPEVAASQEFYEVKSYNAQSATIGVVFSPACGGVGLKLPSESAATPDAGDLSGVAQGALSKDAGAQELKAKQIALQKNYMDAVQAYRSEVVDAFKGMVETTSKAAEYKEFAKAVLPNQANSAPQLINVLGPAQTSATTFNKALDAAAKKATDKIYDEFGAKVEADMKSYGWVGAGLFWRLLTERNSFYGDMRNVEVSWDGADSSAMSTTMQKFYRSLTKTYAKTVEAQTLDYLGAPRMATGIRNASQKAYVGSPASGSYGAPNKDDGWWTWAKKQAGSIASMVGSAVGNVGGDLLETVGGSVTDTTSALADSVSQSLMDGGSPMVSLQNLGLYIIGAVDALITAGAGIGAVFASGKAVVYGSIGASIGSSVPVVGTAAGAVVGGTYGFLSGMKDAIASVSGLWPILLPLIVIGVLYAYVLPMLPFMSVLFLAFGWLVMLLESAIAVIIWAFMLIRMDGQDLITDVQRPGVMIIFNILLRPVIGILGLIATFTILDLTLSAVNALYVAAFYSQQVQGYVGIIGFLALLVIMAYLHWQLIFRTTSLIYELPDRVGRWFGVGHEGLDEGGMDKAWVGFVAGRLTNMRGINMKKSGAGMPRSGTASDGSKAASAAASAAPK